jgi:hypothetical protein
MCFNSGCIVHLFRGFVYMLHSYCNAFTGMIIVYVDYFKILKQIVEQPLSCDIKRINVIIICTYCFC